MAKQIGIIKLKGKIGDLFFYKTNKRTRYSVSMRTKGLIAVLNYTIQFENALSTGEIKGTGMTSDEALEKLKKTKDKLDLGLITQE